MSVAIAIEIEKQKCMRAFITILYEKLFANDDTTSLLDSHAAAPFNVNESNTTLVDEFLALQEDKKGKFKSGEKLSTGLAAAVVGELVLRQLLTIRKEPAKASKLEIGSEYEFTFIADANTHTGDPVLDDALDLIRAKPHKGVVWWTRVLTNYHLHTGIKHLASRSFQHASAQGLLEREVHKGVLVNSTKYHASSGPGAQTIADLKEKIRLFTLNGVAPDDLRAFSLAALICSLMQGLSLVKTSNMFSKQEKKQVKNSFGNTFKVKF